MRSLFLFPLAVLVFTAACGLSLAAASGGYSLVVMCKLLIVVASPAVELGLQMCRPQ